MRHAPSHVPMTGAAYNRAYIGASQITVRARPDCLAR